MGVSSQVRSHHRIQWFTSQPQLVCLVCYWHLVPSPQVKDRLRPGKSRSLGRTLPGADYLILAPCPPCSCHNDMYVFWTERNRSQSKIPGRRAFGPHGPDCGMCTSWPDSLSHCLGTMQAAPRLGGAWSSLCGGRAAGARAAGVGCHGFTAGFGAGACRAGAGNKRRLQDPHRCHSVRARSHPAWAGGARAFWKCGLLPVSCSLRG